ncbi:YlbF family regulator [Enterococcus olivae]
MSNIYDTANQLEREIREMEQFQALSESFGKLKEDAAAYAVFKEFQEFQMAMQQKMSEGQEMTDADAERAQSLAEKIQKEALIADLMQTEQAFSLVLNDLNRIIMTPLRDLYED